jgi:hypothetical protein
LTICVRKGRGQRRRRRRDTSADACIVDEVVHHRGMGEHEAQLSAFDSSCEGGVEARGSTKAHLPAFVSSCERRRGAGGHKAQIPAFVSSCVEARESLKRSSRPLYHRASRRGRARITSPGLCIVVRRGAGEPEAQLPAFLSSCRRVWLRRSVRRKSGCEGLRDVDRLRRCARRGSETT